MKIEKITVKDFRSINKLDGLQLNEDVTVLVGANESGKSNILSAISRLNPQKAFDTDRDQRISSTDGYSKLRPVIDYHIDLNLTERNKILAKCQAMYPQRTETNAEGVAVIVKPEHVFKISEIPEKIIYKIYVNEANETGHGLNINDADISEAIFSLIEEEIPEKVIYFDDFEDRFSSIIPKSEIINSSKNLIIKGLLKICDLEGKEELIFTDDISTRKLLDAAPEKLTKALSQAWYQGERDKIKIRINKDTSGQNLLVDIEDENTYIDFESRSRGFKWFVSFFLKYRAHHDGALKDCLFLIDEPGLFLHPKGQKDLLQYLEQLAKNNQLIYTTHSPFMINRLKPNSIRVVERNFNSGTCINSKGFTSNWKHMRTSLGMVLSDSFYFADKTLLVEGPEDVIYILCLLKYFIKVFDWAVDVSLISVMDSGGVANLPAMAKIIQEEERPLIVLLDSDSPKIFTRLSKQLDKNELKEIKSFDANSVTIQDLLPKTFYENAVNIYLAKLEKDEYLKRVNKTSKKFILRDQIKSDKQVEEFVLEEFGESEGVSKVGIAREFEELILNSKNLKITELELENPKKLIEWFITELDLKSKTKKPSKKPIII